MACDALLDGGLVKQLGRGHSRRPRWVVADNAYASRAVRQRIRRRGIRTTIPHKSNERRSGPFDRATYRQRNLVERLNNRLKQFRRVATRYEKRADNCRAIVTIAAILLWS